MQKQLKLRIKQNKSLGELILFTKTNIPKHIKINVIDTLESVQLNLFQEIGPNSLLSLTSLFINSSSTL